MGTYVKAASVSDLVNGTKKKVTLNGQEIMLAMTSNKYYAIGNRCPHFGGDLSLGKLEGTVITCPRHNSQFDITDGHVVRWLKGSGPSASIGKIFKSPRGVTVFKVKVEGDAIMVEV
jgi:3-phenylpropionate/trans-cinnamate dioxygenase ferredoxin subunit